MSTVDLVERLDAAAERDAEILLLTAEGWSYNNIAQALEVTRSVVAGVVKRDRDKNGSANIVHIGTQKRCASCQGIMPATSENFARDKYRSDGLTSSCKSCLNIQSKERRLVRKSLRRA